MQQMLSEIAETVAPRRRSRHWFWWLGGVGASLVGLKLYGDYNRWRSRVVAPAMGEYITVEGTRLHYLRQGTGDPVVMLHASGLTLQDFTHSIFDQIAKTHTAIAFDRPGYGYSERPAKESLTLALNARLLHEALDQLGIQKPILIGHSSGASVALHYALAYPDALRGLVLIAPSAFAEGESAPPLSALTDPPVVGSLFLNTLLAPLVQAMAVPFATQLFAPNSPPPEYVRLLRAFAMRPSHFRSHADELKHLRSDLHAQSPRYQEITCPVAILAGTDDTIARLEDQAVPLQQALPAAQLVTVSGSGHMVHHDNATLALAALQQVEEKGARTSF